MSESCQKRQLKSDYPFGPLPSIPEFAAPSLFPAPPGDEECFALWDKYAMLANVRAHSLLVARIATRLAERAYELGHDIDVAAVRASALLHDLAKTWCIQNGGSHAILGAAWTAQETGHYGISQGVLLHVHWPWELPRQQAICCLPIMVLYADKRVRHDQFVSLPDRFDDILKRYGTTAQARDRIGFSRQQSCEIELALARELKWRLDEDSADCRRLVN